MLNYQRVIDLSNEFSAFDLGPKLSNATTSGGKVSTCTAKDCATACYNKHVEPNPVTHCPVHHVYNIFWGSGYPQNMDPQNMDGFCYGK